MTRERPIINYYQGGQPADFGAFPRIKRILNHNNNVVGTAKYAELCAVSREEKASVDIRIHELQMKIAEAKDLELSQANELSILRQEYAHLEQSHRQLNFDITNAGMSTTHNGLLTKDQVNAKLVCQANTIRQQRIELKIAGKSLTFPIKN